MKANHSFRRLLTSHTRLKLLNLFFSNPEELYYVRQLVRLTAEEINSVRRELLNLKSIFLVCSETRGNRLYYWANPEHHLFFSLIQLTAQHTGLGLSLLENKSKIGNLKVVMASQSFLNRQQNGGIDLILIGDMNLKVIDSLVKAEEQQRGYEINYMIMDQSEYHIRKLKRDPILVDFLFGLPSIVIGQPAFL